MRQIGHLLKLKLCHLSSKTLYLPSFKYVLEQTCFFCRVYKLLISQPSPSVSHKLTFENSKLGPEEMLAYLLALWIEKRRFMTATQKKLFRHYCHRFRQSLCYCRWSGNSKSQQGNSFKISWKPVQMLQQHGDLRCLHFFFTRDRINWKWRFLHVMNILVFNIPIYITWYMLT